MVWYCIASYFLGVFSGILLIALVSANRLEDD